MTPIELLHTLLLGPIKYLLRRSFAMMSDQQKIIVRSRLAAVFKGALGHVSNAKSLVRYTGSLNGKDFRFFVMIAPFVLGGLVPADWMDAWVAMARFNAVAYRRMIEVASYEEECTQAMHALFISLLKIDVTIFFKRKMHLLSHLPLQCTRLGPGILSASETYEKFVKVLRPILFITNRHNPSRDMAHRFRDYGTLRHVSSGGQIPPRDEDPDRRVKYLGM